MARHFTRTSSEYLQRSGATVTMLGAALTVPIDGMVIPNGGWPNRVTAIEQGRSTAESAPRRDRFVDLRHQQLKET